MPNSIRTSEIQIEFRCEIRNYIGNLRNFATNSGIIWQKLCEIYGNTDESDCLINVF